jgi:hypothetical protein
MYKALVIGLGNIGAMYDWDNDAILTHVKAISLLHNFQLYVFDVDQVKLQHVCQKYNASPVQKITLAILKEFDCISICTPIHSHAYYLSMAFDAGVKLILCEKPIASTRNSLDLLSKQYSLSRSKVLVNLFRRFQPAFVKLKDKISLNSFSEQLEQVNIRYQNGFLNNCIHAFDLLEFLFDRELNLSHILIASGNTNKILHCSFTAKWNNSTLNVTELEINNPPVFEIDLIFKYHKIYLYDSGNTIKFEKAIDSGNLMANCNSYEYEVWNNCIKDYMLGYITYAQNMLSDNFIADNFQASVALNRRMLLYNKTLTCLN